ncbi:MAG: DUF2306 domain-containing protein [Spirosomataceae bacterium]
MKKTLWMIIIALAILVGIIPITYLVNGVNEGYLQLKGPEILRSKTWWFFLYIHAISGGIAILIGWIQFSKKILQNRPKLHRFIGKSYFFSAIICSISGFYIGFYATGGMVAAAGFITVACIYFYTTLQGYLTIRKGQIAEHQNMMTYSYAACLAAVSLRLSTPIAYILGFEYVSSYTFIAWSAWIPNLMIAYWINKNRSEYSLEILKSK